MQYSSSSTMQHSRFLSSERAINCPQPSLSSLHSHCYDHLCSTVAAYSSHAATTSTFPPGIAPASSPVSAAPSFLPKQIFSIVCQSLAPPLLPFREATVALRHVLPACGGLFEIQKIMRFLLFYFAFCIIVFVIWVVVLRFVRVLLGFSWFLFFSPIFDCFFCFYSCVLYQVLLHSGGTMQLSGT